MKSFIALMVIACAGIVGCSKSSNPTGPQSGQGEMKMYMADSPAAFDSVIVEVDSVEVHMETEGNDSTGGEDSTGGWITVSDKPAKYDLLALRNGITTLLGDVRLSAGHYTQIRLMLGAGSYVVVNGVQHALTIPSGFETGIKLNEQFDIEADQTYALTLDFDAGRSIIVTGNGTYMLKPTIRAEANATSGTISGIILPPSAGAEVWTVSGSDTISTDVEETTGVFKLMAVPEGTYTVNIQAEGTFKDTTIANVIVVRQQDTSIGTIILNQ